MRSKVPTTIMNCLFKSDLAFKRSRVHRSHYGGWVVGWWSYYWRSDENDPRRSLCKLDDDREEISALHEMCQKKYQLSRDPNEDKSDREVMDGWILSKPYKPWDGPRWDFYQAMLSSLFIFFLPSKFSFLNPRIFCRGLLTVTHIWRVTI